MKLITFCVPCYNSQDYMSTCIDCLLKGGEEVEIIIVDDGSKDNTASIADSYQDKYPTIVKAVHKPNGGHGSGVNKGVELATGLYYKVIDSDDWLDDNGYKKLLDTIRTHKEENNLADLYIMDFVYNKPSENRQVVREFTSQFPVEKKIGWEEVRRFHTDKLFLMHALVYRTEALRASNTVLPEHTFYVDNIFAYQPLPYMKSIYYIHQPLYMYFIGRADQSVTINNIIDRYKQQITVMNCMIKAYSYDDIMKMEKPLRQYMFHALDCMLVVTEMFTGGKNTKERKEDYKALWTGLKAQDKKLYKRMKHHSYSVLINWMPFSWRSKIMLAGYKKEVKKQNLG